MSNQILNKLNNQIKQNISNSQISDNQTDNQPNLNQLSIQEKMINLMNGLVNLNVPNPLDPEFEEPKRYGDYTRLEEGENTLRILSEGIVGVEYWIEEFDQESGKLKKKPIRRPIEEATTIDTDKWAYFHAYFVWNYTAQKIQILCTTKRGIIKGLKTLINSKWGDIKGYDICINRVQTDSTDRLKAEYSVINEPPAILDPEIAKRWEQSEFNRDTLLLLFVNQDPFELKRKRQEELKNKQLAINLIAKQ